MGDVKIGVLTGADENQKNLIRYISTDIKTILSLS